MPADREDLAATIFHEAADLPARERAAFLDRRCAGDRALRDDVEALLAADARGSDAGFLTPPALTPAQRAPALQEIPAEVPLISPGFGAGTRIGRYRILRAIASGGMGSVFEAAQDQPRRTVALKVMRAGMISPSLLRRFEYEAQVLGSLQHPGIAQVHEAGTHAPDGVASHGVPFIAMELIAGARPLVDHAVEAGLSVRERIELMARVCDAVQYAHQRGVIHRDLKPGNILVDSAGQPKVIDFGIASVTGADITAATMQTGPGQLLGTLRYMSPEQCEGDSRKIDTRSDVYALGVVLYELLTGRHPYDLSSSSLAAASRVIREVPPIRPSTVHQMLRGDVETIVLKALEKEPERRYQSAGDLAADLRRWLADEPILARPPSTVYQLRKFARRNRPLVVGASAALLALVAGTIGTAWQAIRATHQRDRADQERATAQAEAEISRRITEFFEDLLASADPEENKGKQISVLELVDKASAEIGESLKDQPLVEAGVRAALGKTYIGLGDYPKAEAQLLESIRIRKEKLGPDAAPTLEVRNNLTGIYWMQGRLDEALPEARDILRGMRTTFGVDSDDYLHGLDMLATVLGARGEFPEAIDLNKQALEAYRRLHGSQDPETAQCLNNLAYKLDASGHSADAEPMYREALAITRNLKGNDDPSTLALVQTHSNCLRVLGKLDESEALALECLEGRRRIYPANHPFIGDICELMGRIKYGRKDYTAAIPYLTEALENHRVSLPEKSWRTASSAAWLGMSLTKCRHFEEAEKLLLEAHATLQLTKGQHPPAEKGVITALVDLYNDWGNTQRADDFAALLTPTR